MDDKTILAAAVAIGNPTRPVPEAIIKQLEDAGPSADARGPEAELHRAFIRRLRHETMHWIDRG